MAVAVRRGRRRAQAASEPHEARDASCDEGGEGPTDLGEDPVYLPLGNPTAPPPSIYLPLGTGFRPCGNGRTGREIGLEA